MFLTDLANFVSGHLITISTKPFSILTTGFRGEDVSSFLHRYIRETGHAPQWPVFDGSNFFSSFVEGHPVIISTKLF